MNIALVAAGYIPKPPMSNSIYNLIWKYKLCLEAFGHTVDFYNEKDLNRVIDCLNTIKYDFIHLHAFDFVKYFNQHLNKKYCFTCHYGYLLKESQWNLKFQQAFNSCMDTPGIIALSSSAKSFFIGKGYSKFLRVQPNGIDTSQVSFRESGNHKAICLGWIQPRKQQKLLANRIDGALPLDFIGPLDDPDFTEGSTTKYLGIWSQKQVYANLTNYSCLVLMSDGEVAPLVVIEALAAGLCLVVSESASANLHTKDFITILPDNILSDSKNKKIVAESITKMIDINKYHRKEIVRYAVENFDLNNLTRNYIKIINESLFSI
ncbi:glycosyltransferase [Acaryochloris sp. IP29b_bin.148]|uniref:glycosyltransferase n=1 Tax=Acaryochloris sp. IP29b_bin.148 TaxID=2969218 RepID=UPI002607066C|nr:glycosyltransferase [Acaryochloris sp. IP29b_bin.148]